MAEWRDAIAAITGDANLWEWPLSEAATRWEINTDDRLAAWLANCAQETAGFKRLVENLNYSPQGLLATWPSHFTPAEAVDFAHDAKRIAERAYGGRNGNGPEGSGDGYGYRGRGGAMLTGRNNYERCGPALGVDLLSQPELLEQPKWAAQSAGWFWSINGCNPLADAGKFQSVVLRWNGGTIGMNDRLAWLDKTRAALA